MRKTRIHKYYIFFMVCVLLPLLLGGILYYIFCPNVFFVKCIDSVTGIEVHLRPDMNNLIMRLVRFYGFDIIWAYSFTNMFFILVSILHNWRNRYILIPTVFVSSIELLQKTDIMHGTFDYIDIVVQIIGSLFAMVIINILKQYLFK